MKDKGKTAQKRSTGPRGVPGAKGTGSGGGVRGTGTPIESRFQAVFERSRDAIGVSKAGMHVFVNPAYLELFGFPPDADLAGKPILDLIAPESRDHIKAYILRRKQGEALPSTYVTRGMRSNGAVFDMEVNVSLYQENGEDHTLVILRDITERKQAEEEIAERGALLQQIMDTASVAIGLVDKTGRITHANRCMSEMFGRTLEELAGCEYVELIHPSERETGRKKMLALLASEIPSADLERLYWRKDGTEFWGHLACRRFHDVHGNELGLIGVITDISERKQAEDALKASAERFRLIYDQSPLGTGFIDTNGVLVDCNEALVRIIGSPRERLMGFNMKTDVRNEAMRASVEAAFSGKAGVFEGEYTTITSNKKVALKALYSPLRALDGAVKGILFLAEDITEKKRSEDLVRASEKKFSAIFSLIPDPTTITDIETGRLIDLNDAATRLFGHSREEAIGMTSTDLQAWADPSDRDRMLREIRSRGAIDDMAFRLRKHTGEIRSVLFSSRIIELDRNRYLLSRVHDITESKRMEEALLTNEALLTSVVESSADAIFVKDLQGRYVVMNSAGLALTGKRKEDILGKNDTAVFPPAEADRIIAQDNALISSMSTIMYEHVLTMADGPRMLQVRKGPVVDKKNHVSGVYGISRDITERKQSELDLKQSEEKYRRLYNETPVLLHSVDRDFRVVEVNDYWLKTMGYGRNEVIGRKVTDFYADASLKYARNVVQPAFFRDGIVKDISYQFIKKNGEVVDVLLSATAERDAAGNVVRSLAVIEDITERKRVETALRESEERFKAITMTASDAILLMDDKGKIVYWNPAAGRMFGYSVEQAIGKDLHLLLSPERLHKNFREGFGNFVKTGQGPVINTSVELMALKKDGSEFPIEVSTSGMNIKGRWHALGIIRDISDRKRAEQEILKSQKLESIGTLAGGIAHDFNNLLQGVFGFISMAKLTFDQKEKSLAMLTQAEKALHQSVNLTSQLLTFSKGGKPVKKVFALRPLIENSVAFALSGSRVTYEIDIDNGLRAIQADAGQIGQVIQNIVLNADQAMPLGGTVRVSVRNMPAAAIVPRVDLQDDLVEISIRDQGTGIPAEHLTRIFDPYFTTKEKGSGLGLATAYSIIKNHGGLIRVQSEIGKGTTFFVYLPASAASGEEPKSPAPPTTTRKSKILVMDDEEIIRAVAGEMLTTIGHEVAFAESGETALEAYQAARRAGRPFDVVVLDLTIRGGMGGMETLRKLVEIDPNVRAVVSSGYSDDAALSNYRHQGFRAFLKKPYNMEDLQSTLNACLSEGNKMAKQ